MQVTLARGERAIAEDLLDVAQVGFAREGWRKWFYRRANGRNTL